jgi:hypothetical protein
MKKNPLSASERAERPRGVLETVSLRRAQAAEPVRGSAIVGLAALVLGVATKGARALDVEIDSDASFQLYEVRAFGATALLARRRLVSNLGFRLVEPIGDPDPDGRRLRVSLALRLRLYQDFGDDCLIGREICVRASDASEPSGWQPLSSPSIVDLPMAWVSIDGLPLEAVVRLGRQLEVDPVGFVRFDGPSLRMAPASWIGAEAFAGLMVRGTSLLGTPQFELPGTMRVDRGGASPLVATFTDPPASTWVVGARVRGGPGPWLQLGGAFREAWEESGTVLRRLAVQASSQPLDVVRLEAVGVLDLLEWIPIDAVASIEFRERGWTVRGSVERRVPRFDPGSIWAWFTLAPIDQVRLGGSLRISEDVEIGGALRGRRAELGGERGEDLDGGLEGSLNARIERIDASVSGFVWTGSLGPVAGISIDARRRILSEIAIGFHGSVWHFDDPFRQERYGTVISESLDAVFDLTDQASIVLELQHAASRLIGHRFRGIVWLRVETWR